MTKVSFINLWRWIFTYLLLLLYWQWPAGSTCWQRSAYFTYRLMMTHRRRQHCIRRTDGRIYRALTKLTPKHWDHVHPTPQLSLLLEWRIQWRMLTLFKCSTPWLEKKHAAVLYAANQSTQWISRLISFFYSFLFLYALCCGKKILIEALLLHRLFPYAYDFLFHSRLFITSGHIFPAFFVKCLNSFSTF